MDTIFVNSEKSKTSEPHVLIIKLTEELDLRRGVKSIALSNLSIYYTWKNIKSLCNNNKFEKSDPTWNDKSGSPDGSYSVSDIQYCFEYIFKKHNGKIDNPSIKIYVNKTENRITCKIKTGYYLELSTPDTMKLFGSTKNKITKDKDCENVPHFEITEVTLFIVVLVHCNIVNNDYQQDSNFLYTFVPNKPFDNLLKATPTNFIPLKTFNPEFRTIEVWFTDQNSQPSEIEDR